MEAREKSRVTAQGTQEFIYEFEKFLKKAGIAYSKDEERENVPEGLAARPDLVDWIAVFSITASTLSIASSIIKIHEWYRSQQKDRSIEKKRRDGEVEIEDVDFDRYILKSREKFEKRRSKKKRGKTHRTRKANYGHSC